MALASASRFARAFTDLVLRLGDDLPPPTAVTKLRSLEELFAGSPELRATLLSPAVPTARKHAVVERLGWQSGWHELTVRFLQVVLDHRRVGQLGEIRRAVETTLDERLGLVRADVTSAQPLGPDDQGRLQAELSRLTGKQVRCEFTVRPELLGGVTARVGSTIYDGSVRGRLESMREQLVG